MNLLSFTLLILSLIQLEEEDQASVGLSCPLGLNHDVLKIIQRSTTLSGSENKSICKFGCLFETLLPI